MTSLGIIAGNRRRGGGGGGGYPTPTLPSLSFIADITHYWDVDQRVTTVGTNEVSKWADLIGAVEFDCTSTSTRPVFSATAINGNPGIDCASAGRGLRAPYTATDGTVTFAFVATHINAGSAGGRIFSVGSSAYASDQTQIQTLSYQRSTTSSNVNLYRDSTQTFGISAGYNTPVAVMLQLNGTDTRLFVNNSQGGGNTLAKNANLAPTEIGVFQHISSGSLPNAQGYCGDIMVINRALTAGEKTELHTYFNGKFGT